MAKQEIQISSVKLINGGLKGLEIKYLRINDVNSNLYKSEMTEKNKRPVNIDMQLKFEEFKDYLAELCSIDEGKLSITGITASHNKFLISGTVEVLDKKKSAINTPLITEEDGYEKYEAVQEKVDGIYKMVLEYMEKEAYTATNEQMILQFNKGKEGFDAEAVKNMTEEEQVVEATKLLEKIGCVVMNPHEEDMPGGIEEENDIPLKDISAGDEKEELFSKGEGRKEVYEPEVMFKEEIKGVPNTFSPSEIKEELAHPEDFDTESLKTVNKVVEKANVDFDKKLVETEAKKQKAAEQLAKLKASQAKVEQVADEDDDFIPLRKVM